MAGGVFCGALSRPPESINLHTDPHHLVKEHAVASKDWLPPVRHPPSWDADTREEVGGDLFHRTGIVQRKCTYVRGASVPGARALRQILGAANVLDLRNIRARHGPPGAKYSGRKKDSVSWLRASISRSDEGTYEPRTEPVLEIRDVDFPRPSTGDHRSRVEPPKRKRVLPRHTENQSQTERTPVSTHAADSATQNPSDEYSSEEPATESDRRPRGLTTAPRCTPTRT